MPKGAVGKDQQLVNQILIVMARYLPLYETLVLGRFSCLLSTKLWQSSNGKSPDSYGLFFFFNKPKDHQIILHLSSSTSWKGSRNWGYLWQHLCVWSISSSFKPQRFNFRRRNSSTLFISKGFQLLITLKGEWRDKVAVREPKEMN